VLVQANKKWLSIAKTLAYSATKFIMAVKRFMIQAQGPVDYNGYR